MENKKKTLALKYNDAEQRAAQSEIFFKEVLKVKVVKVYRNLQRKEIINIMFELHEVATEFENSKKYDTQAVNAIFVNWIGFSCDKSYSFMNEFEIDERIFPPIFQLTKFGEPIALGEYFKMIAENKKT